MDIQGKEGGEGQYFPGPASLEEDPVRQKWKPIRDGIVIPPSSAADLETTAARYLTLYQETAHGEFRQNPYLQDQVQR